MAPRSKKGKPPGGASSGDMPPDGPITWTNQLPQAVILAVRERLMQGDDESIQTALRDKLGTAIYPATRGPERVIDRLAYGEVFTEKRHGGTRHVRVTRSGATQEDPESTGTAEVAPLPANGRGQHGV